MTRRLVDADALRGLCEAAAAPHPDPYRLRAALSALAAAESTAPDRPWLSVREAAQRFGVADRTVRRSVARGEWPQRRIGRRLLVAASGPNRTRADTSVAQPRPAPDDDTSDQEPHRD